MHRGHLPRLTALALATGTLVAAGAAPAGAATAPERVFDAAGSGAVLRIEINLPSEVPGVLPQRIVQDIALADGAARTGTTATALGNALIGSGGNVPVLADLLAGGATASASQPRDSFSLAEVPENPLGLTGGALRAVSEVTDPDADGAVTASRSSIASLQLAGTGALDAVLAPLQAALEQALGAAAAVPTGAGDGEAAAGAAVAPVTTTVNDLLGQVLDTLDEVSQDSSAVVTDEVRAAVEQVTAALEALLADLTLDVAALSDADSLLDIGLMESTSTVTRAGQSVTSEVTNELAGIRVLGGLVDVSGISSRAVATLGGDGASSADASATLLEAGVGDLVSLEVADDLRVLLGGTVGAALPADVLAQVNAALAQVTDLLSGALGLQTPTQARTSESSSADAASAVVEAASLVLDPLGDPSAPLLRLGFVPAEATVEAQALSTPVPVSATPVSLPRTGGELPLTGAVAALLVATALVSRRRRAASAEV